VAGKKYSLLPFDLSLVFITLGERRPLVD